MRRLRSFLPLALGLALLPGCAGLWRSYDVAPDGLTRTESELRQALAQGLADSLLVQHTLAGERAPGDELLRTLYGGVAAFHAGRYQESGALLDVASVLADERATKSISRSALALISNDKALPYEPSPTERLLIPYYGAQGYLRLHDLAGAAVEARRLAALLEQYPGDVSPATAPLHAALRYFAGAVFEAAGERNDAAVSYRHAGGLAGLDTVAPRLPADSGDVVVFIDYGFVAHRVEEALTVLLAPVEVYGLRDGAAHDRFAVAALVAERVLAVATVGGELRAGPLDVGPPAWLASEPRDRCAAAARSAPGLGSVLGADGADSSGQPTVRVVSTRVNERDCRPDRDDDDDDDLPYLLRVAWPSYRWTSRPPEHATIAYATADSIADGAELAELMFGDVSQAVVQDFRAELPLIVARTVARGVAKAALTRGAERKLEKKHEGLGKLVGLLGNVGNVLLERADTRSWHLLPGSIGVARVRLPAGRHALSVRLADGVQLPLEEVTVSGGGTTVATARAW